MLSNAAFDKWLVALRSGKYKKHTGSLTGPTPDCFCALGVLAFPVLGLTTKDGGLSAIGKSDENTYFIPTRLMSGPNQNDVWRTNDMDGLTFPEIADWLEKERHGFVRPRRRE